MNLSGYILVIRNVYIPLFGIEGWLYTRLFIFIYLDLLLHFPPFLYLYPSPSPMSDDTIEQEIVPKSGLEGAII